MKHLLPNLIILIAYSGLLNFTNERSTPHDSKDILKNNAETSEKKITILKCLTQIFSIIEQNSFQDRLNQINKNTSTDRIIPFWTNPQHEVFDTVCWIKKAKGDVLMRFSKNKLSYNVNIQESLNKVCDKFKMTEKPLSIHESFNLLKETFLQYAEQNENLFQEPVDERLLGQVATHINYIETILAKLLYKLNICEIHKALDLDPGQMKELDFILEAAIKGITGRCKSSQDNNASLKNSLNVINSDFFKTALENLLKEKCVQTININMVKDGISTVKWINQDNKSYLCFGANKKSYPVNIVDAMNELAQKDYGKATSVHGAFTILKKLIEATAEKHKEFLGESKSSHDEKTLLAIMSNCLTTLIFEYKKAEIYKNLEINKDKIIPPVTESLELITFGLIYSISGQTVSSALAQALQLKLANAIAKKINPESSNKNVAAFFSFLEENFYLFEPKTKTLLHEDLFKIEQEDNEESIYFKQNENTELADLITLVNKLEVLLITNKQIKNPSNYETAELVFKKFMSYAKIIIMPLLKLNLAADNYDTTNPIQTNPYDNLHKVATKIFFSKILNTLTIPDLTREKFNHILNAALIELLKDCFTTQTDTSINKDTKVDQQTLEGLNCGNAIGEKSPRRSGFFNFLMDHSLSLKIDEKKIGLANKDSFLENAQDTGFIFTKDEAYLCFKSKSNKVMPLADICKKIETNFITRKINDIDWKRPNGANASLYRLAEDIFCIFESSISFSTNIPLEAQGKSEASINDTRILFETVCSKMCEYPEVLTSEQITEIVVIIKKFYASTLKQKPQLNKSINCKKLENYLNSNFFSLINNRKKKIVLNTNKEPLGETRTWRIKELSRHGLNATITLVLNKNNNVDTFFMIDKLGALLDRNISLYDENGKMFSDQKALLNKINKILFELINSIYEQNPLEGAFSENPKQRSKDEALNHIYRFLEKIANHLDEPNKEEYLEKIKVAVQNFYKEIFEPISESYKQDICNMELINAGNAEEEKCVFSETQATEEDKMPAIKMSQTNACNKIKTPTETSKHQEKIKRFFLKYPFKISLEKSCFSVDDMYKAAIKANENHEEITKKTLAKKPNASLWDITKEIMEEKNGFDPLNFDVPEMKKLCFKKRFWTMCDKSGAFCLRRHANITKDYPIIAIADDLMNLFKLEAEEDIEVSDYVETQNNNFKIILDAIDKIAKTIEPLEDKKTSDLEHDINPSEEVENLLVSIGQLLVDDADSDDEDCSRKKKRIQKRIKKFYNQVVRNWNESND